MKNKLTYLTAIKFLSKYINKHKQNFIMFYLGWLFDSILIVVMPILFGIMIDEIVYYQNIGTFINISIAFIILTVFSCVLYFLIYFQHSYLMNMYTFDIRSDIYKHLLSNDALVLSNTSTGDIISNLQDYSDECMHFVIRNIIHITNRALMMIAYATYLLIIDWRIGLFALCVAPISVFINAKTGMRIRDYGEKQRTFYSEYISWLYEILSAFRDIRMLGAVDKTKDSFYKKHEDMFSINIKSGLSNITAGNILSFTNIIIQLCIFSLVGYAAINGNITVGVLTIILSFYGSFTSSVRNISEYYLEAQNRISFIQHIYDFMQTPTEDAWEGTSPLNIFMGQIEFSNISFEYNERTPIVKEFNLRIFAGERIALIGKSGCGKTTLAYMLIGFYRPQMGFIMIDEQKLTDCNLHSIRQSIGLVQQDVLIFDGSIRENINIAKRNASDDEIKVACQAAELWEFIDSLPDKLDTIIGSNGLGISGGQKQRVAIARIYLKNPQIIIFDEATSSLDSETEEEIHKAWEKILAGRTAIVIAHRQSSVMLCDRAVLIEDGHIIEKGSPKEMAKSSEKFQALFSLKESVENA